MSKIVIDARESGTSTGRYVDKLIEHLHKLQPKHSIIIVTKAERTDFFAKIAPAFTVVQTPFKEFTFNEQIGFRRQLIGLEPDLVHFGMVQQPVLFHGKVVTTMHDLITLRFKNPAKNPVIFTLKQLVYRWVNLKAARKSVAVITPTQYVKDDVVAFAHIPPEKVIVTLEAADYIPDKPVRVAGLSGKPFILYVGRPTPHKNLGRLIEAFQLLQKDRPELHLVLVGKTDFNYQQHEATVRERDIQNVVFTGFMSEAQLKWLYEHCTAYAFPSSSEGFGLPGLEAMVHGAPVASSNATCLPEVLGNAAHYFNPLDVTDIAAKIGEVVDDPTLRAELIEKGKQQAAKYSWDTMAKQTLEVYEKALTDKSGYIEANHL